MQSRKSIPVNTKAASRPSDSGLSGRPHLTETDSGSAPCQLDRSGTEATVFPAGGTVETGTARMFVIVIAGSNSPEISFFVRVEWRYRYVSLSPKRWGSINKEARNVRQKGLVYTLGQGSKMSL